MAEPTQSWSIVVFCYNEQAGLPGVIEHARRILPQLSTAGGEIVVVDDGSADQSPEIAQRLAERHPEVRLVRHPRNLGIGHALLTGYRSARCENVVAVPADGQFDLDELLPHREIPAGRFISYYRKVQEGYSLFRTALSRINAVFNRLLGLTLKDVNWVKAYKRDTVQKLPLSLTSSLVASEICAKLGIAGQEPIEVGSFYLPRQGGTSSAASWGKLRKVIFEMPKLWYAVTAFRFN